MGRATTWEHASANRWRALARHNRTSLSVDSQAGRPSAAGASAALTGRAKVVGVEEALRELAEGGVLGVRKHQTAGRVDGTVFEVEGAEGIPNLGVPAHSTNPTPNPKRLRPCSRHQTRTCPAAGHRGRRQGPSWCSFSCVCRREGRRRVGRGARGLPLANQMGSPVRQACGGVLLD